ncbi:MAG: MoaD/ThiS family protein [Deltaproteobacteria bacterium]|nr:MoaD/ThiS family protein [Deltaproteobacteria bacterium]
MKVEVKLYASLARYLPYDSGRHAPRMLEIEKETTIIQLLEYLKVPLKSVKLIFLNGIHATGDETLNDGDRLGVFPPVAGG